MQDKCEIGVALIWSTCQFIAKEVNGHISPSFHAPWTPSPRTFGYNSGPPSVIFITGASG